MDFAYKYTSVIQWKIFHISSITIFWESTLSKTVGMYMCQLVIESPIRIPREHMNITLMCQKREPCKWYISCAVATAGEMSGKTNDSCLTGVREVLPICRSPCCFFLKTNDLLMNNNFSDKTVNPI